MEVVYETSSFCMFVERHSYPVVFTSLKLTTATSLLHVSIETIGTHEHQRIHNAVRLYKCDDCEKLFTNSSNLKQHKRIHTNYRPYNSDDCDKAFKTNGNLKRHTRIHIGVTRPNKCDFCDKTFIQIGLLKQQQITHTEVKTFKNEYGELNFHQRTSLKSRISSQSDKRPYKCISFDISIKA